jgi:nitrous oxide reductase accessory protein NosL
MMQIPSKKCLAGVLLVTVVLAGCGGGGGGVAAVAADISQSLSALVDFMNGLIASTSPTSQVIDVNNLNLVTSETASPTPF